MSKRWDGNGESLVPASLAATELALLVKIARIGLRERIVPASVVTHLPMEPVEAYRLSYAEISFLLGFQEPSSFFRAFRQWTGETPESTRLSAHG